VTECGSPAREVPVTAQVAEKEMALRPRLWGSWPFELRLNPSIRGTLLPGVLGQRPNVSSLSLSQSEQFTSKNHSDCKLFTFSLNFKNFLTMSIYYFENWKTKITAMGRHCRTRPKFVSCKPCVHTPLLDIPATKGALNYFSELIWDLSSFEDISFHPPPIDQLNKRPRLCSAFKIM
jgi:hypothetical protein